MAMTDWIDRIADRWATIQTTEGGSLKSYYLFEKSEFPESVTAPCVITYPTGVNMMYSEGGPIVAHWIGRSDFFLFDNVSKVNTPNLCRYYEKIMIAAIGAITLGNTCEFFMIDSRDIGNQSIQGFLSMTYGDESPKHGMVVNWKVKDNISNDSGITVAA